ncbi:MAG: hypothetical protein ACI9J2_001831 [Saprospiraceae bacterium]|jgi:hypothetical protein
MLGVKSIVTSSIYIGGHEPMQINTKTLIEWCEAVINGGISVEYRELFGRVTSAKAFLHGKTFHPVKTSFFGKEKPHQFQQW